MAGHPGRALIKNRQIRYMATAAVVVLLCALLYLATSTMSSRVYRSYKVEKIVEKTDSVSHFAYAADCAVRYSTDGASLIRSTLDESWHITYTMTDPQVDVCGNEILLYDRGGTDIYVCNLKQQKAAWQTSRPILAARISGKDTVAAITRHGDATELQYYTADGTEIASGQATMSNPGYPVSLSLSEDGLLMAVSYLTASDGNVGSCVRFYQFGNDGKGKTDNMVGEAVFTGEFAPVVQYLSGNECVVFRDGGFSVFQGSAKVQETKHVDFDAEICTVFQDGTHMGLVFRSDRKDHKYMMKLYTANANLLSTTYFDQSYDNIRVCGDHVIFSNRTGFSVYSMKGVCRFSGRLKDAIVSDVLKMTGMRLLVVTDSNMEVIRLT